MNKEGLTKKTGILWVALMAYRDGRASSRRLILFMAAIVLGIMAVVAIQSFSANLKENISLQSKSLMGADFLIDSNQFPTDRVLGIIDSLGGSDGMEVNFASMAAFPKADATKLVRVRGIAGDFPIYGALETEPLDAAINYSREGSALVDATAMLQYNLRVGDSVKIGEMTFAIGGALKSAPGSTAISSSVAPPVIIPYEYVEQTGLLQMGSRLEYNYYFKADEDTDLLALDEKVDPILDAENADLDSHLDTSRRLGRRYDNFGKFLNLVAFIALLLGCVGIASSVNIYIREKLKSVAILKCMGATRKQSFYIFLFQIAAMGFIGGVIGALGGVLLQQLFPYILQDFLPFEVTISWVWPPILQGILLGISMSVLFALLPLLGTWFVSPLQVLRIQEHAPKPPRPFLILILSSIMLFVFLFSLSLLENWRYALSFVLGIMVTFAILSGIAGLFMWGIKKYFPSSWGFCARQSLLSLFRPQNQTRTLILAVGVGTFLISTLYFTKDILLAKAQLEPGANSPNIIVLDVQSDQQEGVTGLIEPKGLAVMDNIPIVTMRVQELKGRPVNEIRLDTTSTINGWILSHEFRVTYRDSLIASETLLEGDWVTEYNGNGPIPISLAYNVAQDAEVGLGDAITFNVQGVLMETVVKSIREVDWGRMQLNFSIVFPKGVLEQAPKFHVITTSAKDEASSAELQRDLVSSFPNLSIIDLRQVINLIEDILDKISWVINFMAFFSILTGIIVLIGAVRTSKYQRIRESVLLRTLGAKGRQILKIAALEYLYLGILGSGFGILLSLLGSELLAYFVFETGFTPSVIPFVVVLPGITALVLGIGLLNSTAVLNSPPLQVLRKEKP
ncbi:ABC transporter permease [Lentiprolixibacter aurantiacus]|uniref:ABC transporter permease n=1 Tax=Lentiprolixibacter aurantiacus TaxID=2993939 RepID=A0AAE3MMC5_9FLAO|nr:FtsX-like permease family protein [Lentiprolixibacter aurantiacus]MCX2720058.1 ABC transporter permease [Lentiprolixibacter aurantiacus]